MEEKGEMVKILKYGNRKMDTIYWDISSPKKEREAVKELFQILDEWQLFEQWSSEGLTELQKEFDELDELYQQLTAGLIPQALVDTARLKVYGYHGLPQNPNETPEPPYDSPYTRLKRTVQNVSSKVGQLDEARAGSDLAMRQLLDKVRGEEYADWEIVATQDHKEPYSRCLTSKKT